MEVTCDMAGYKFSSGLLTSYNLSRILESRRREGGREGREGGRREGREGGREGVERIKVERNAYMLETLNSI